MLLEKLLLPAVEYTRLEIQLVAQIRHRHLVNQMPLQDCNLFLRLKCLRVRFLDLLMITSPVALILH